MEYITQNITHNSFIYTYMCIYSIQTICEKGNDVINTKLFGWISLLGRQLRCNSFYISRKHFTVEVRGIQNTILMICGYCFVLF